jgi:hypothetical protein
MAPAFSSIRGAATFALLLALIIALPALMGETGWLSRRDVYPAIPWKYGPFLWIQQQIFDKKTDVDVAFMGSSHIWNAIDTPLVQKYFSQRLGRPAEVITLGWPWNGFDAAYIIGRDLLEHRHVHTLVIDDEGFDATPHYHSSRWFRMGDNTEALAGLPLDSKLALYGGAVLGMPRQLLNLARPNLLDDPFKAQGTFWDTYYHAPNVAQNLGALRARLGWNVSPNFIAFKPQGDATPADTVVYSAATRNRFSATGPATSAYQLHFMRKLATLCAERGTHLVFLVTPHIEPANDTRISVRELFPELLGVPSDLIGLPQARFFAGIPPADRVKLFYEGAHANQNGQTYFTQLITPKLFDLYAQSLEHN